MLTITILALAYSFGNKVFTEFTESKIQRCLLDQIQELKNIISQKDAFVAGMIHDLRNPVIILMSCIELLKSINPNDQDRYQEAFSNAQNCGKLVNLLIGNILDFSKLEAQKMELYLQESNIARDISNVVQIHAAKAIGQKVFLKLRISSKVPLTVSYDQARVMQVLVNLISNAIKFTKQGGVTVSVNFEERGAGLGDSQIESGRSMTSQIPVEWQEIDYTLEQNKLTKEDTLLANTPEVHG